MSSLFGLVGVNLISGAIEQAGSLGYVETQGTILSSQLEETQHEKFMAGRSNAEKVSSYAFKVRYAYDVGGHEYTGTRVAHNRMPEDLDMAEALSRRFALNARVPIYYPADKPSQAVLLRTPEGVHVFYLLVAFALLTCMACSWYALVWEIRRRSRGIHSVVTEGRVHARWGLGLEGWIVLAGLSLLASYLLPSELILSLSWGGLALFFAVLIAASVFVEWRRRSRIRSGALGIVIDPRRGVVSLPPMRLAGRRTRFTLPLNRIQQLHVEERFSGGGQGWMHHAGWALVLSTNDEVAPVKVTAVFWIFEDKVDALWLWLKQRPELKHVQFVPR